MSNPSFRLDRTSLLYYTVMRTEAIDMTTEDIKSMPFKQKIARINELAKKSKSESGLTDE